MAFSQEIGVVLGSCRRTPVGICRGTPWVAAEVLPWEGSSGDGGTIGDGAMGCRLMVDVK
jgi:hypothetical protein